MTLGTTTPTAEVPRLVFRDRAPPAIAPAARAKLAAVAEGDGFERFPALPVPVDPVTFYVAVQSPKVRDKTKAGVVIAESTRQDRDRVNTAGKVVAVGPAAFKDRQSGEEWFCGPAYTVGDVVTFDRHAGRRFKSVHDADVSFRLIPDDAIDGRVTDPDAFDYLAAL